eukprot:Gb_39929 [translate_table: standard]
MMRPPPPWTSLFAASLQHRNVPLVFTLKVRSQSSSLRSMIAGCVSSTLPTAALLTTMWIWPKHSEALSNICLT